jgi:hypothetical protein
MLRVGGLVAALCLPSAFANAEPWVAPGDSVLRSDLQTLADAGVLKTPVTTWPLAWGDIKAAVDADQRADLDEATSAALVRVRYRARIETLTSSLALHTRLALSENPQRIRTFEDTPRDDGEAALGLTWTGNRFAVHLTGTAVSNPLDGDSFRLDGSYLGVALGNWMLSTGYQERWWGPGWDGSLILSTNARPAPHIALNRNSATPFEPRWLQWIGPWSLTTFMGKLDDERVVEDALSFGMRFSAKPLPQLEIGISRTAQWCGDGRPCDWDTFVNLLVGRDNQGVNVAPDDEPGNQLGGFDLRWAFARHAPVAVYMQWIGEDTRQGGPQIGSWLRQAGVEFWSIGQDEQWQHRTHLEIADTMCREGGAGSGGDKADCAYEHSIYTTGYRYLGQSMGHSLDGDGLAYTAGSTLNRRDGRHWRLLARHMEINRVGVASTTHTLSATPQKLTDFTLSHGRPFKVGELRVGVGYSRLNDEVLATENDDWFGWLEFRIN